MIIDFNSIKSIDNPIIKYIFDHVLIFVVFFSLIAIFIYAIISVFLNKVNTAQYGKTTWMAWVPVFREYLLGKLTIHPIMGIILAIGYIFGLSFSIEIDEVRNIYSFIPESVIVPYCIIYLAIIIILYIYAHIKLSSMRRDGSSKEIKNYLEPNNMTEYDLKYSKNAVSNQTNQLNNNQPSNNNQETQSETTIKLQDINKANPSQSVTPNDNNSVDELTNDEYSSLFK